MKKRMEPITVYVSDDNSVCIKDEYYTGDESIITIHPDQIDTIIQWLKEAKSEALQNKASSISE